MRRLPLYASLLLTLLFFSTQLTAQQFNWAGHGAGPGSEGAFGVAVDGNGNGFITGFYVGPLDIGDTTLVSEGRRDIYIAKYDANGNFQWARSMGGPFDDVSFAAATDGAGNIYISGFFETMIDVGDTSLTSAGFEDLLVAKYDGNGNFEWAFSGGGFDTDRGAGIAVTDAGTVWVTGYFAGNGQFGDSSFVASGGVGDRDIFLLKLDSQGNFERGLRDGGPMDDLGKDVGLDANGNVYLTGSFQSTAQIGNSTLTAIGTDVFLVKYDANGNFGYAVQDAGSGIADGRKIAVSDAGEAHVLGNFNQSIDVGTQTFNATGTAADFDFYVAKYDPSGNFMWAQHEGSPTLDNGNGIALDGIGNVFVSGNIQTNAVVGDSLFLMNCFESLLLVSYSPTGTFQWAIQDTSNPGGNFASSEDLACTPAGVTYLAGIFGGSAYVGDSAFTGIGNDAFIATYTHLPVGIEEPMAAISIDVYPNPVETTLNLDLRELKGWTTLTVVDVMGRTHLSQEGNDLGRLSLDVETLPAGLYFVNIEAAEGRKTIKVIKE